MLFAKIIGIVFRDAQWLLVMSAAVYTYGMYRFLCEYCNSQIMTICSFLAIGSYLPAFNAMTQAVAIGVLMLAWIRLNKGHTVKALLLWGLAMSFHVSAIAFVVAFIVKLIPANKKTITVLSIIIMCFATGGTHWYTTFLSPSLYIMQDMAEADGRYPEQMA